MPSSALYGVVTYSRIRMSQMALVADDPDDPRTVEFDCDFVHYGMEGRRLRVLSALGYDTDRGGGRPIALVDGRLFFGARQTHWV